MGSLWRPTVSSIVVKSMQRSSPGPLHGSFCSLAMGGVPSYFLLLLTTGAVLHLIDHVLGHPRPPKSLLHKGDGVTLALMGRLVVAPIHRKTSM